MKNRHRQPSVVAHNARPCIYDSPISNLQNADKCAIVHSNAVAASIGNEKITQYIFIHVRSIVFATSFWNTRHHRLPGHRF